jgi:hypothetical protein
MKEQAPQNAHLAAFSKAAAAAAADELSCKARQDLL